jgi:phage tail-like protein
LAVSTPFDADSGTYQGRIIPTNWTPINGEYVYCIGHDLPGQLYEIAPGMSVTFGQTFDSTGFNALQLALHLRCPESTPFKYSWRLEMFTFGGAQLEYVLEESSTFQERTITDVIIPALNESIIELSFVLTFVGPLGVTAPKEVELPGIYIDAGASANFSQAAIVMSRDPAPDATGVWPSRSIEIQAASLDGSGLAKMAIIVNGIDAVTFFGPDAAVIDQIVPGWGATAEVLAFPDVITRYRLTPPEAWTSESVVHVAIEVVTLNSATEQTSWSFTIADTIGPRLVSAQATALLEVTCTWNEQLPDSALDPALYTLTLDSDPPAYVPTVVDVLRDSAERIVFVLDQPATPGATYIVTAVGVVDMVGNAVEAPYDVATFETYVSPLAPANRLLSLYQELPEAERDTDVSGELRLFCDILDEGLRAITTVVDEWPLIVADPDTAREDFLDAILWELGNPFDWLGLSVAKKRVLARVLHALYALKGGGPGIVAAIRLLLGIEVKIHVYGWGPAPLGEAIMGDTFILGSDDEDDLYTFWVIVAEQLDEDMLVAMDLIIKVMKVANERHIIVDPDDVFVPDHWALGFSELGVETLLHA